MVTISLDLTSRGLTEYLTNIRDFGKFSITFVPLLASLLVLLWSFSRIIITLHQTSNWLRERRRFDICNSFEIVDPNKLLQNVSSTPNIDN